jgi:mannosyltransferase
MPKPIFHVDGLIFSLQKHGGIHRFTKNLLLALDSLGRSEQKLLMAKPAAGDMNWVPKNIPVTESKPLALRPARVFSRLNSYSARKSSQQLWQTPKDGFFVATYYSTYPELRVPQISFIHDMIYELFPDLTMTAKQEEHKRERSEAIKRADYIVCPSMSAAEDIGRFFDISSKKLTVINYGVEKEYRPLADTEALSQFRQAATGGAPYFLTVGGRDGTKNFTLLLMAYSRWTGRNDIHIVSVGGGPLNNQENSLLRALRLQGKVHAIPSLTNEELIVAYNAAAGFIMPSQYEGFGFPVLEAMACGTPVATSNVSSLPEVGGDVAIYFDPTNNDSILQKLSSLADLRSDKNRIAAGIRRAEQLSWPNCANQFVDWVASL